MKILSKLFLIVLILSSGIAKAVPSFYWMAHTCFELNRHLTVGLGPVAGVVNWAHYKSKAPNLPDAPEIVVRFCREKLKAQGLNPGQVQIKVREEGSLLAAFGKNFIVFTPLAANNLKNALENSADENSIQVTKIYSTFIDHEIAHLKNNDVPHRLAVLIGASALVYLASSYIVKTSRLNSLFQEPTNIKNFAITYGAYGAVNVGVAAFIKTLYGLYAQHQEKRADAYAISLAKDPEALRHSAKFLETVDNGMIDFICGADLNSAIPLVVKFQLKYMRNVLVTQYQVLKPKDDFRTWVKQQTTVLAVMKFMLDVEHPSGFSRAQTMCMAANKLEAEQKAAATKVILPEAAPAA